MANNRNSNTKAPSTRRGGSGKPKPNYSSKPKDTKAPDASAAPSTKWDKAVENIILNSSHLAARSIAGNPVYADSLSTAAGLDVANDLQYVVPGVYSLEFVPVFGKATGANTDPVNLSIRNIWMNLRSLYSNRIPYTANAIAMYAMAMDSILCMYQHYKRAYGICFAFDARNRYVADGILYAMGINPHELRAHLPEFRTMLNRAATQMSVLGVPTELKFIHEHVNLCAHVYMDDTTPNAQYIVPVPAYLYYMDWANNKLLATTGFSAAGQGAGANWAQMSSQLQNLIESFVNYEDVYMIASDMARLYPNLATIQPVDDDYMIGPEYDEAFLNEIHNASIAYFGHTDGYYPWEMTCNEGPDNVGTISAKYSTGFAIDDTRLGSIAGGFIPTVFDFDTSEPSVDEVVRAANWKFVLKHDVAATASAWKAKVETCGTQLLIGIRLISMGANSNTGLWEYKMTDLFQLSSNGNSWTESFLNLEPWKKHPLINRILGNTTTASNVKTYHVTGILPPYGDLSQYFEVDINDLRRIHEAIILDAWDAAGVGTMNLSDRKSVV